ncbi:MAG TPA: SCO family protein [Chitinophagaceae bacterium]|nr:SCO family protein [Chitinophagaceae bacterium]
MNKKALLGILLAVILPLGSYLIVKQFTDGNEFVPRRLYYDTVLTTVKDGKESTDTVWHKVKDFQLTNQLGNTASLSQLDGKVLVVDFFFTHCGSICPMLTKNMKKLQNALKMKDEKRLIDTTFVHFLSFSVDPERDSAPQLKKFADRYGINHDTWWMLTGPKHTIYDFAINEVKLGVPDSASVDTSFIHSEYFVLLDRDRVVRGYYSGLDSVALGKLSEDIVFLMLEKDKKKKRKLF